MPYPEVVGAFERWDVRRDTPAYVALCADPEVMRFLGGPWPGTIAEESSRRIADHWRTFGYGLWAARVDGRTAGFAGVCKAAWLPGYEREVEIGWRLARWAWGRGVATAGGSAALEAARAHVPAPRIIAIVDPDNARSLRVAARIGLAATGEVAHDPRRAKPVHILA